MHSTAPHEDDAMLALMESIIDDAVGVIIDSRSFEALRTRLLQTLRPIVVAPLATEEEDTDDGEQVDFATRGLAMQVGFDIWNATPVPDNDFRPLPLQRPQPDSPCLCGSGHKYQQCCGAVESPFGLILPSDEMMARVLKRYPAERIGEIVALGAPVQTLGLVADEWVGADRAGDAITLLEPLFADLHKLDARAELAADALCNAYLESGAQEAREAFVARLKTAPDKQLRAAAWQRDAALCSDRGDYPNAWAAFKEAQRLGPDNPALSHLEVLLLLHEGRGEEARARADFWAARLARDPQEDHSELIALLQALAEHGLPNEEDDFIPAEVEEALAALPSEYAERRLVIDVRLEGIEPPIWRRLEVENTLSFAELHLVLQAAMGWDDAHLYEFTVGDQRFAPEGEVDPFGEVTLPADAVELGQVIGRRKSFGYIYDFGDEWRHRITIEQRLPADPAQCPTVLLDGARACPPEDCGGVPGYEHILEAKRHPRRAESREVLEWLGPYNPETFKLATFKKAVRALWRDS